MFLALAGVWAGFDVGFEFVKLGAQSVVFGLLGFDFLVQFFQQLYGFAETVPAVLLELLAFFWLAWLLRIDGGGFRLLRFFFAEVFGK